MRTKQRRIPDGEHGAANGLSGLKRHEANCRQESQAHDCRQKQTPARDANACPRKRSDIVMWVAALFEWALIVALTLMFFMGASITHMPNDETSPPSVGRDDIED